MNEEIQTPPEDIEPRPEEPAESLTAAPTSDERTMALLCHLGGLLASFVIPLIIWLIKKDESRFVDDQGKEALNFQINLLIHAVILAVITVATCGFGGVLYIPWGIYALIMPIIACVQANKGERYRYPATFRMIT